MEPEKKSNGALVGLIIIIVILIIGGIYIWLSNQTGEQNEESAKSGSGYTDQEASALNALEEEAENTDPNTGVDADTIY